MNRTTTPACPSEAADPPTSCRRTADPWHPAVLVRLARRRADLSQRDLARNLRVSQSLVAAWETGERQPSLAALQSILGLAGLVLAVAVDPKWEGPDIEVPASPPLTPAEAERLHRIPDDGAVARAPMVEPPLVSHEEAPALVDVAKVAEADQAAVVNRAGHRFGAHLDVSPAPSLDLPERGPVRCPQRALRNGRRVRLGVSAGHPSPGQITESVRLQYEARREALAEFIRTKMRPTPAPEPCHCADACYEAPVCLPECPCQCEPHRAVYEGTPLRSRV